MTSNTTLSSSTDDETTASETTLTPDAAAPGVAATTADEHRLRHDFDGDRRLSTSVVLAVANALETDPLALDERLYDVIDPDALDRLFDAGSGDGGPRRLSFELAGCSVLVRADGHVVVRRA